MTFSELTIGDGFLRRSELLDGNLDWASHVHICVKHTDTKYRTLGLGWGLSEIETSEEVIRIRYQDNVEFTENNDA